MGQRHQIFIVDGGEIRTFHNQWLYGHSAVQHCLNILQWDGESDLLETMNAIPAGFWARTSKDGTEKSFNSFPEDWAPLKEDFTAGHNNDGVHIVDPEAGKCCFMENFNGEVGLVPRSGREYAALYYPGAEWNEAVESTCAMLDKFTMFTPDELVKLFPKLASEIRKANKHPQPAKRR